MKICLALYGNRLASLFENANQLKMYEYNHQEILPAGELWMPESGSSQKISAMLACGVNILICGGLSRSTKQFLSNSEICVWDWIRGQTEEVLQAWKNGSLDEILMPGCKNR